VTWEWQGFKTQDIRLLTCTVLQLVNTIVTSTTVHYNCLYVDCAKHKIYALSIMISIFCFRFVSQFLGKYSPQSGTRVKVWWQSCHIWHPVYPPHDVSQRSTWPDFLVLVIWRYTVQHDVHPKFTSNPLMISSSLIQISNQGWVMIVYNVSL